MIWSWLKRRRRRRWLASPMTLEDVEVLRRQVLHYRYLPEGQRARVDEIVRVMVAEKEWVGAGVDVTSIMRLTIAGYAAVLVSGFDGPYFYDQLQTIVVRPRAFRYGDRDGLDNPNLTAETRSGEAWQRGPIVLSWRAVERAARSSENVALHEFAHHLDGLAGAMDGLPYVGGQEPTKRWHNVTEGEFMRLTGSARRGEATLLDHYGATSRAEFFAVATECFFQQSHAFRERHGELYAAMADFYRQEPHQWMPRHVVEGAFLEEQGVASLPPPRHQALETGEKEKRIRRGAAIPSAQRDALRLQAYQSLEPADALFTLALDRLDEGDWQDAVRILTRLLIDRPDDEEALAQRAVAHQVLGNVEAAAQDVEQALALDPDEVDALLVRAGLRMRGGLADEALKDLDAAVRIAPKRVEPRYLRAQVYIDLGHHRQAVRDLTNVLAIDPYNARAYAARGRAYEALGKARYAESDRLRAHWLDPEKNPAEAS